MSLNVGRRVYGHCGAAFVLVIPPGEDLTDRDKLCSECLTLPPPPQDRRRH